MQKYHAQGLGSTFFDQKLEYLAFGQRSPGLEHEKIRSENAFVRVVTWEGGESKRTYFHLHSGGQGKSLSERGDPSYTKYSPPNCSLPGNSPIILGKLHGEEWSHQKNKGHESSPGTHGVPRLPTQPFPFQSVTRWGSFASQHTETHKVNQNNRKKQGKSVYPLVLEQPKLTILGKSAWGAAKT